MAATLTVTDHADPAVGLFGESWEIPCPFNLEEIAGWGEYGADKGDMDYFKAKIIELYSEYATGKVTANYDFEFEKLAENER